MSHMIKYRNVRIALAFGYFPDQLRHRKSSGSSVDCFILIVIIKHVPSGAKNTSVCRQGGSKTRTLELKKIKCTCFMLSICIISSAWSLWDDF